LKPFVSWSFVDKLLLVNFFRLIEIDRTGMLHRQDLLFSASATRSFEDQYIINSALQALQPYEFRPMSCVMKPAAAAVRHSKARDPMRILHDNSVDFIELLSATA
jgi:hypothetical protein